MGEQRGGEQGEKRNQRSGKERKVEERGSNGKEKDGKKTKRKAKQRWEKDVTPHLCFSLCSCLFGGRPGTHDSCLEPKMFTNVVSMHVLCS